MSSVLTKGKFAQVVGTFDLAKQSGTIDYVTPVVLATVASQRPDEGLHLVGVDNSAAVLFKFAVKPQRNSCAPHANSGTFDEFVPVSPQLRTIKLLVGSTVAAQYTGGEPLAAASLIALAGIGPNTPHKMNLESAVQATPGVSYSVQAKPDSAKSWMTLAVGLVVPTTEVNVNQFPGATSIDVRVLRTDGFSESEVFRETKHF